jgi:hypothetical protein
MLKATATVKLETHWLSIRIISPPAVPRPVIGQVAATYPEKQADVLTPGLKGA